MILKNLLNKSIIELKNSGIKTAELDASIILNETVKQDGTFVYINPKYLLTNAEYSKFRKNIRKRKKGMPIAYIVGHKEFYGYDFFVNKSVLIPRPETEFLVETSLNFINKNDKKPLKILDMGTGSGCILISIGNELNKKNLKTGEIELIGSDISRRALSVAKKNAKKYDLKNIKFFNSDLFSNKLIHKKYDLIIANLPYVPRLPENEIIKNGINFEPKEAIFASQNGTKIILSFLMEVDRYLSTDGMIILETDKKNNKIIGNKVKEILPNSYQITNLQDLARLDRYIIINKK